MDLCTNYDTEELLYAAQIKFNNAGQKSVTQSLLQEAEFSPYDVPHHINKIKPKAIVLYSALDAVAVCVWTINLSLSKYDYNQLWTQARTRNCDPYPSYDRVLTAKKTCFFQIEETVAEIQLQALLDHTAQRILEATPLDDYSDSDLMNAILTMKWKYRPQSI